MITIASVRRIKFLEDNRLFEELEYILDGIVELANQHQSWSKEYNYIPKENNFNHLQEKPVTVKGLFEL